MVQNSRYICNSVPFWSVMLHVLPGSNIRHFEKNRRKLLSVAKLRVFVDVLGRHPFWNDDRAKGLLNGILSHPFGTPWRVQVPSNSLPSGKLTVRP